MLWDKENRLLSVSDNGFVSNYWYDASGERTVKESGDGEGVLVNGVLGGARTGTTNFTAYISPYLIVRNGGEYTKHSYMGGQRITSKVSNSGIFANSPVTTTDLQAKCAAQTASLKARYDSLGITYKGTAQTGGLISSSPSGAGGNSYFYHSDHLGSSSLITDVDGNVAQHIEYVPYGEVFVEERNNNWSTPYKFNGKELDEETGLYYYGARYYDPRTSLWVSVDPLAEKYMNISSYVYCADNPVKFVDPDGKRIIFHIGKMSFQYSKGNFWVMKDGKMTNQRYNPSKESTSKAMYALLRAYRKIENSDNKVLKKYFTHWKIRQKIMMYMNNLLEVQEVKCKEITYVNMIVTIMLLMGKI